MLERPFALPANSCEVVIDLPLPPSVNRTRKIDYKGHRELEVWRNAAALHLVANGQYKKARTAKIDRYELTITLNEDCKKDPSNILKNIEDFLVIIGTITGDGPKHARRIIIEFGDAPDGARVTVRSYGNGK